MPEPPRLCELRNDSSLEVVCQPGNDGGLQQHFVLEAVGATSMYFNNLDSTRSTHEILDNEISTMNDQVRIFPSLPFFMFRRFDFTRGMCFEKLQAKRCNLSTKQCLRLNKVYER